MFPLSKCTVIMNQFVTSPQQSYALFYFRDMEINHVTCGVDDDGIVVYHEQFPNQLAVIYGSRCGYIYTAKTLAR